MSNKAAVPVSSVVPLKKPHAALLSKHSGIINRGHSSGKATEKGRLRTPKAFQSLLNGTPDQDRTDNYPLGGGYYIHLTTGANILATNSILL